MGFATDLMARIQIVLNMKFTITLHGVSWKGPEIWGQKPRKTRMKGRQAW